MEQPSVCRSVHYVAVKMQDGENVPAHRAATITEVDERGPFAASIGVVSLCVMHPTGLEFLKDIPYSDLKEAGSWHWPERV